ncbi:MULTISPECIES: hypothetical protein [Thiomicrorhabdus]|uniref:DUF4282 domain-containing protein n=1 Tax=Thiomicrorhabdus heinhorstiae TaxID=2748010 RepID=A0ABS0BVB4_9GAMM|nr:MULTISPECIES: hypothetical protein [Thiomicrorhabdus]MBF6056894.1 hypothetical protein [Thiomicrorhabdus heinhorstiae]
MHPKLNFWFQSISLVAVVVWLYFTFVEKSLISRLFEGQALLIDLLLGLPLVLALAVVIYASVFWTLKLILVLAFPQFLQTIETHYDGDEESIQRLEDEHGQAYWEQEDDTSDKQTVQNDQPASNSSSKKPD